MLKHARAQHLEKVLMPLHETKPEGGANIDLLFFVSEML